MNHRPLIAIVGDAAKSKDPALAKRAAEDLGAELARKGCRILVFSSKPEFVEWEAVQGYLKSKVKKEPRSIEVRYPPELDGMFPGEEVDDPRFVRTQQGGDWEASIYPSFAELDGLILIGGGYTTKVAGLLALGSRTPLITLGGLGGAAQEVWTYLRGDRNSAATEDDLNLMATRNWSENSAARFIGALLGQRDRKLEVEKQAALGESERHRRRMLTILAMLGSGLFFLVLLALVESWTSDLSRLQRWLLLGTPAIAGASGAAIRVLWDNWQQQRVPLELRPITMTVALGFWASGVAGALFILPQIWVFGTFTAEQAGKLSGFAVPVGLLAGLTLDRVFPRLIKYEVPLNTAPLEKAGARNAANRSAAKA
jgi:hypothetical protein